MFQRTSVENESIYTDFLVSCDAYSLNEALLVAQCAECGHEPAIAVIALSDVVCGRAFDEESGFLKYVLGTIREV